MKNQNRAKTKMVNIAMPITIRPLQPKKEYLLPRSFSTLFILPRASLPLSKYSPNESLVLSFLRNIYFHHSKFC